MLGDCWKIPFKRSTFCLCSLCVADADRRYIFERDQALAAEDERRRQAERDHLHDVIKNGT